jgi:hypothetical protein
MSSKSNHGFSLEGAMMFSQRGRPFLDNFFRAVKRIDPNFKKISALQKKTLTKKNKS